MAREPWKITREMFLSLDEVAALEAHLAHLAHCDHAGDAGHTSAVDRVIIESLLYSGLRNSEFCRLSLADVQLGVQPAFEIRGTPREDRTVYLPNRLAELLRRYLVETRPFCLADDVNPRDRSQPFVTNERGRPYERTALYRRVVRILAEAGLGERASVQLLRHTYGYLAYLRTGSNLLFVQRQLGHAHPMVTSVYAEFIDESYADLANAIAGTTVREPGASTPRRKPRSSTTKRS